MVLRVYHWLQALHSFPIVDQQLVQALVQNHILVIKYFNTYIFCKMLQLFVFNIKNRILIWIDSL